MPAATPKKICELWSRAGLSYLALALTPVCHASPPGTGTGLDAVEIPLRSTTSTLRSPAELKAQAEARKIEANRAEARAAKERQARESYEAKVKELEGKLAAAEQEKIRAAEAATPTPLRVRAAFPGGPSMVELPERPDSFLMDSREYESRSSNSGSGHRIAIAHRFEVGQTEVTVSQYLRCVNEKACSEPAWREPHSPLHFKNGTDDYYRQLGGALTGPNFPIVGVSWLNAQQYAKWVTQKAGLSNLPLTDPRRFRLPSEAEWEYAARSGDLTDERAINGNLQWQEISWIGSNSEGRPHEGASKLANNFKLSDMVGNVWEWVQDCHAGKFNYDKTPTDGSAAGSSSDTACSRVVRGGAWNLTPIDLQYALRGSLKPDERTNTTGFRLARTLP